VTTSEQDSSGSRVPETATHDAEIEQRRERWGWVEPAIWTDRMITALETGVKGGRWFSLMDKVSAERTLAAAWDRVKRNRGAAGQRDLPRPSPTSGVCDIGAFEVQGSGPTAARVGQFHAARQGNVVRFSWRVTAGANLAGFSLMAGGQRLNARLIQVHASPLYRVHLRVMAGTRFQLQAVLRSGKTITVASA